MNLSGLGAVGTGYLDTLSKMSSNQGQDIVNQINRQKLQAIQQDQGYTTLAGSALQLLGGGTSGPPGGAGAGGSTGFPSPVSSPAPQPDQPGPSPAGRPATQPAAADPNNPGNWTATEDVPGAQQPGGPLTTLAQPRQNVAQGQPAQPAPAQPAPAQPAGQTPAGGASGGAPAGRPATPGGGAPAGGGAGGQRAPGVPQSQGGLTLERAIQAVVQAARMRGQQVTPDMIYGAVSKLLPLLNNEDKMRYQMALAEYKGNLQFQMLNERLASVERVASGHDTARSADTAARVEGRHEDVAAQQTGASERTAATIEGRHEDVATKGAQALERLNVSAASKREIQKLRDEDKEFLTAFVESQKNQRASDADMNRFRNLNLTLKTRQEIARAAQEGATSRATMAETGRESRFGRAEAGKDERAAASLEQRRTAQTALQSSRTRALDLRQQQMQQPGKSVAAREYDNFLKQYPNATVEDWEKFKATNSKPSAAEVRLMTEDRQIDSINTQIDKAIGLVRDSFKSGPYVVGAVGAAERGKEVLSNITNWSDETAAHDFESTIDRIKLMVTRALGAGRRMKADTGLIDNIVRGLTMGSTRQNTFTSLTDLKKNLQDLKSRPSGGDEGIEEGKDGKKYRLKPGTDRNKRENWEEVPDKRSENLPPGARKAPDGNHYVPDPDRPGKYLMVVPNAAA